MKLPPLPPEEIAKRDNAYSATLLRERINCIRAELGDARRLYSPDQIARAAADSIAWQELLEGKSDERADAADSLVEDWEPAYDPVTLPLYVASERERATAERGKLLDAERDQRARERATARLKEERKRGVTNEGLASDFDFNRDNFGASDSKIAVERRRLRDIEASYARIGVTLSDDAQADF